MLRSFVGCFALRGQFFLKEAMSTQMALVTAIDALNGAGIRRPCVAEKPWYAMTKVAVEGIIYR